MVNVALYVVSASVRQCECGSLQDPIAVLTMATLMHTLHILTCTQWCLKVTWSFNDLHFLYVS